MNKLGVLQGGYNVPADDMGGSPRPMPRPTPQRLPLRPMEATDGQPDAFGLGRPQPVERPGMNSLPPLRPMKPMPFRPQGQPLDNTRPMPRPFPQGGFGIPQRPIQPGAGAMNPQLQAQALGDAFQEVAGGIPTKPMQNAGNQFASLAGGIQPNKPYYR